MGAEDLYLVGDGGDPRMRVRPGFFSSPSVEEAYGYRPVPRVAERAQLARMSPAVARGIPLSEDMPMMLATRRSPAAARQYPKPVIAFACVLGVAAAAIIMGIIVVSSRKHRRLAAK